MTIRPWLLSDAEALAEALNDEAVQANLRDGLPYPYTVDDAREFISAMLSAGDSVYPFAITHEGRCVGSISVTRGVNIHRFTGELGYYVGRTHWGFGLATRAVREICRVRLCQHRHHAHLRRAVYLQRRVLPRVGKGRVQPRGYAQGKRRQGRRGAGYAHVRAGPHGYFQIRK